MFVKKLILLTVSLFAFSCFANDNLVVESNGYAVDHFYKNRDISNSDAEMDFEFTELNYQKFRKGMGYTRITRLSDEKILFEGATPEFSNFYISEDGVVVGYNVIDYRVEPTVMIFDNQGNILFSGFGTLYLEKFEENIKNDIALIQASSLQTYSSPQDFSSRLEAEGFNSEEIIYISCSSRRARWIDSILSIEMNKQKQIKGFWFVAGNESKYFNLLKHQELLAENNKEFEKKLAPITTSSCRDSQIRTYFDGINYSAWCENYKGKRVGAFARWLKLDNEEIKLVDENNELYNLNLKVSQGFLFSVEGSYGRNGREDIWKIHNVYGVLNCNFENNKLHGRCERYDEGVKFLMMQYKRGKAHGLNIYYFANGNIESQETRVLGITQGVSTEYHYNGEVSYLSNYLNGLEHGQACSYSIDGDLYGCEQYKYGVLVKGELVP